MLADLFEIIGILPGPTMCTWDIEPDNNNYAITFDSPDTAKVEKKQYKI